MSRSTIARGRKGRSLRKLAWAVAAAAPMLLAADASAVVRTWVATPVGELSFQEWFVRRDHQDEVEGVRFEGAETATATSNIRREPTT